MMASHKCKEPIILLFFFLILHSNLSSAAPSIVMDNKKDGVQLGRYLDILEDPDGKLMIEEVAAELNGNRFVPSQVSYPSAGLTRSVY
ncbi:MAG: hypothetical protein GY850_42575 [bacterium]|nr:hypothetical protein [bacterium]